MVKLDDAMIEKGKSFVDGFITRHGNSIVPLRTNTTTQVPPDYLSELLDFFSFDKVNWNAGTYDQYLFDLQKTINDNYEKGNYQVAFFYSHFIFMSYVYYCIEKSYELEPNRIKDVYFPINAYLSRDDKPDIESYSSVYDFSKIPEKDIFKIFHVMGMPHQQIKDLSKYISTRDAFAHATGKGNISEEELENNIRSIKGNMGTIHKVFQAHLTQTYINFLLSAVSCKYEELANMFEEFIFEEEFSNADIVFMCNIGISGLRSENETLKRNYRFARKIHCAFLEFCVDNYSMQEPSALTAFKDFEYLKYKYHNNAEEYIENELGISAYTCGKDGGEFPLYECPECGEEQLVYDGEKEEYCCFSCNTIYAEKELSKCCECGDFMVNEENLICEDCWNDKMKK